MTDIVERLQAEIDAQSEWMLADDTLLTDAKAVIEAKDAYRGRLNEIIMALQRERAGVRRLLKQMVDETSERDWYYMAPGLREAVMEELEKYGGVKRD